MASPASASRACCRGRADGSRAGHGRAHDAGVQSEAPLPFAGLHQLLRPVRDRASELRDVQRAALDAAFGLNARGGARALPDRHGRPRPALGRRHRAPLLLVVEDAHWLDRPTADALAFVARRIESDPIVLLAAIRDGYPSPLVEAGLPEHEVTGLDEATAAALLDAAAPGLPPEARTRVLREAAGNPLAILELPAVVGRARTTRGRGGVPLTERLERAFADRVRDLPGATRCCCWWPRSATRTGSTRSWRRARPSRARPWISTPPGRQPRRASWTPICGRSASGIRSSGRRSRRAPAWPNAVVSTRRWRMCSTTSRTGAHGTVPRCCRASTRTSRSNWRKQERGHAEGRGPGRRHRDEARRRARRAGEPQPAPARRRRARRGARMARCRDAAAPRRRPAGSRRARPRTGHLGRGDRVHAPARGRAVHVPDRRGGAAGAAGDHDLHVDLLWLVASRAWWVDPGPRRGGR